MKNVINLDSYRKKVINIKDYHDHTKRKYLKLWACSYKKKGYPAGYGVWVKYCAHHKQEVIVGHSLDKAFKKYLQWYYSCYRKKNVEIR